jgi:DNA polymerase III delta' subunit
VFEGIVGQERAKAQFARALAAGTLAHAYLLAGPEGLGKVDFAREVGVALVTSCRGCGECAECDRARRGAHPDLRVVEREGERIRIEQIAPLVAELALKPFAAERRVWIVPEVEQLTLEAANKLLKSVEEPPAHVHFLLVSDRAERVLPTIVSRCQIVEFRALADVEVEEYLRVAHGLDGEEGRALARLARGSVERAARAAADARGPRLREQYLAQVARLTGRPAALGERTQNPVSTFLSVLDRRLEAIAGDTQEGLARRLDEIEAQVADEKDRGWYRKRAEASAKREKDRRGRQAAVDSLELVAAWVRDLWVVACGAGGAVLNCDRAAELADDAVARPELYARLLAATATARKDLYLNVDQKLALQAMFARFEEVARSG